MKYNKFDNHITREVNELFKNKRDCEGKHGSWVKYLLLLILLLSLGLIGFNKLVALNFEKHQVLGKARKVSNDYVTSPLDGSGMGNSFALERVVVEYEVEKIKYRNTIDIYYKDYQDYFDSSIDDVDSLNILFDSRNPERSVFPKIEE